MYIVRALGASSFAAKAMAPSGSSHVDMFQRAATGLITSDDIDPALIGLWTATKKIAPGYDKSRQCYYWGYRPAKGKPVELIGVHGLGTVWNGGIGPTFSICPPNAPCAAQPECAAPPKAVMCPPPKECPVCATVTAPEAPQCPVCATVLDTPAPTKFGVNLGLVAAIVLTGGVGIYGYKKGWFGKKRR